MDSTDTSIQDARTKLKSWIISEYDKVKAQISQHNQYYASSLMIQLFLRRVVEMYIIDNCYPKVAFFFVFSLDHSEPRRKPCKPGDSSSMCFRFHSCSVFGSFLSRNVVDYAHKMFSYPPCVTTLTLLQMLQSCLILSITSKVF